MFHRVLDLTHRARGVVPGWVLRHIAAPLVQYLPARFLDLFFDYPAYLGEQGRRKVVRYLQMAANDTPASMYQRLITFLITANNSNSMCPMDPWQASVMTP